NDLIEIAGGTNVLSGVSPVAYPQVSLESVLQLDPDVIVDTIDMGATETAREQRNLAGRALWGRFPTISAVRSGRIHARETDALFMPGPRVVDAAEWLADLIHGELRP